MYIIIAGLLSAVVCMATDVPPIPYAASGAAAAASASAPTSYSTAYIPQDEEIQHATGQYIQHYNHGADGFNIQSGFEGYLVPSSSGAQKTTLLFPVRDGLEYLSSGSGIHRLIKFISAKGLRLIPKVVLTVVGLAGLFLLGCVVTTAVCTFTPFCTISFLGWGVARESMRSFLTEDRISATAAFVTEAIRKYQELYDSPKSGDTKKE